MLKAGLVLVGLTLTMPVDAAERHRRLWIRNVHTGMEFRGRPFGRLGLIDRWSWSRVTRLFGDPRTSRRRTVHPRLIRVLVRAQHHFGARRLELYSGYRAPGRGLNSYHEVAHAADVAIEGVPPRTLFEWCRLQASLGCGLYPQRRFVHIDVRSVAAIWVDLGHHDYVADPDRWLRAHPGAGPQ